MAREITPADIKLTPTVKRIAFVIFLLIAYWIYTGVKLENEKNEFSKLYFNGDYNQFDNELEHIYGGDFEIMKSSYQQ